MKSPQLLKLTIDICFILLVIDLFSTLSTYIIFLITGHTFPVFINDREIKNFTFQSISIIIANVAVAVIGTYAIYLLRKLVRSFFKNKYFTSLQISLFKKIGQLIVFSTLLQFAVNFFSVLILEGRAKIGFSVESSYYNIFFIFSIGLFFIYLSKLFEKSRSLQEENDLTV